MTLFCNTDLAARIERFDCRLMGDATDGVRRRRGEGVRLEISGGLGLWAGADSPMNKVVGLGFAGALDQPALADYEAAVRSHGSPSQIELCSLARPDLAPALCARGYRLMGFENMSARRLGQTIPETDAGLEITADDDIDTWIDVMVEGFATPDAQGNPSHEAGPSAEVLRRAMTDFSSVPRFHRFLARWMGSGDNRGAGGTQGTVAGAGGLRIDDGIASLCGAATLPAFRRRGVQTSLLLHRLRWAANAGCELAIVTTLPGSKSQQNVQRAGFEMLYARAMLVLEP